uniref:ADIPOR-like receptor n=1 Tax=Schistocephalus solidus TaxID=70667 RepID=A0A183S7P0_SCHSO
LPSPSPSAVQFNDSHSDGCNCGCASVTVEALAAITSSVLTRRKHRRTHSAGLNTPINGCSNGSYGEGEPTYAQPQHYDALKSDSVDGGIDSTGLMKVDCRSHRRSASYGGELFSSATREISEVASRVAEQAEELVLHLWEQGWRVVHHTSLPLWLRDNDYLLWGHRPPLTSFQACFRSIFRLHTETVNIWTHLIGEFVAYPGIKFPWQEKIIISVFFLSAIAALAFSWLFHTVSCHSEHVGVLFSKYDLKTNTFFP